MSINLQIATAFIFLLLNIILLRIILSLGGKAYNKLTRSAPPAASIPGQGTLDPADILGREFSYAQSTASEAMRDRHTMIQFYLVLISIVASGVIALVHDQVESSWTLGTLLLWLLISIGWLYFLKIVRLRQAWHESARTMNQIKEFYFLHAKDLDSAMLRSAFRWQAHTLPAPGQPWTLFFLSAMVIGLVDSVAFVIGSMLLNFANVRAYPLLVAGPLVIMGLLFLGFHVWLYFAFLRE
ncbi:MAG TPA: hypothetical protein VNK95_00585 [Caldilineaceae bacterium]|nr:hypothetical protein [Caldilineaceae bacterium]